jgi:hypothetical protein
MPPLRQLEAIPALASSHCLEFASARQLEAIPALASSHCLEFELEGGPEGGEGRW